MKRVKDLRFWQKDEQTKYRAKQSTLDGKFFASNKERRRYEQLKLLLRAGEIRDLKTQVAYDLNVNGFHVCKYIADFVYFDVKKNKEIVEDTKSAFTAKLPVYKLKKKLMLAVHGIKILES